jgi:hypothetical protein
MEMGASAPAGLTGLSAPIPRKKGAGAFFTAGFPLQSLARPVRRPFFSIAAAGPPKDSAGPFP